MKSATVYICPWSEPDQNDPAGEVCLRASDSESYKVFAELPKGDTIIFVGDGQQLQDARDAWKLQAHDHEDALLEIIAMCGEPVATELEPKDAVNLVRKMIDQFNEYKSNH